VINAEGEFQAAARLSDAADLISRNPVTIQLRALQTLMEVSGNASSTIVFPVPMSLLQPLVLPPGGGAADGGRLNEALEGARRAFEATSTGLEERVPASTQEQEQLHGP
jgi:hypothetical protein